MVVACNELEAICEGAIGEAVATSATADGKLETRVGEDLVERCIVSYLSYAYRLLRYTRAVL